MNGPLTIHIPPSHYFWKLSEVEKRYWFGPGIKIISVERLPQDPKDLRSPCR